MLGCCNRARIWRSCRKRSRTASLAKSPCTTSPLRSGRSGRPPARTGRRAPSRPGPPPAPLGAARSGDPPGHPPCPGPPRPGPASASRPPCRPRSEAPAARRPLHVVRGRPAHDGLTPLGVGRRGLVEELAELPSAVDIHGLRFGRRRGGRNGGRVTAPRRASGPLVPAAPPTLKPLPASYVGRSVWGGGRGEDDDGWWWKREIPVRLSGGGERLLGARFGGAGVHRPWLRLQRRDDAAASGSPHGRRTKRRTRPRGALSEPRDPHAGVDRGIAEAGQDGRGLPE